MGKLNKMLLMGVKLPPLDKYRHFHIANFMWTLSSTECQQALDLKGAPKERPR